MNPDNLPAIYWMIKRRRDFRARIDELRAKIDQAIELRIEQQRQDALSLFPFDYSIRVKPGKHIIDFPPVA